MMGAWVGGFAATRGLGKVVERGEEGCKRGAVGFNRGQIVLGAMHHDDDAVDTS